MRAALVALRSIAEQAVHEGMGSAKWSGDSGQIHGMLHHR